MELSVLTIFPQMITDALSYGVVGRALDAGLLAVRAIDLRCYTHDSHRSTDDTPYGGGGGMVMKLQPVAEALHHLRHAGKLDRVIVTDPQGQRFTQRAAEDLASCDRVAIICGRYEGVDERIKDVLATHVYSIGDFVLSGGELAALVIVDAVTRLLPGVLGWAEAPEHDSFADGLLDWPHYTKPRIYSHVQVPRVLLDGNHADVMRWRRWQQLDRTRRLRPDLWARRGVTMEDLRILADGPA